jgi:ATP-dependent Lhr-like helicase
MNDYGFELLTDKPLPINEIFEQDIFTQEQLLPHILAGLNSTEMARRKFRDIAHIAGLIFTGYPGKTIKNKHLQASSRNFFDVFSTYEPNNLLLKQAYEEVLFDQLDETRLRAALTRLQSQSIIIKTLEKPSPFCFPIMVERIRSKSINEPIEDIIQRLIKNS